MTTCANCGAEQAGEPTFCSDCGTRLAAPKGTDAAVVRPEPVGVTAPRGAVETAELPPRFPGLGGAPSSPGARQGAPAGGTRAFLAVAAVGVLAVAAFSLVGGRAAPVDTPGPSEPAVDAPQGDPPAPQPTTGPDPLEQDPDPVSPPTPDPEPVPPAPDPVPPTPRPEGDRSPPTGRLRAIVVDPVGPFQLRDVLVPPDAAQIGALEALRLEYGAVDGRTVSHLIALFPSAEAAARWAADEVDDARRNGWTPVFQEEIGVQGTTPIVLTVKRSPDGTLDAAVWSNSVLGAWIVGASEDAAEFFRTLPY